MREIILKKMLNIMREIISREKTLNIWEISINNVYSYCRIHYLSCFWL